jgi:F-type H+-transporting ATPase subunit b
MKREQERRSSTGILLVRRAAVCAGLVLLTPALAAASEGGLVLVPEPRLLVTLIALFVLLIAPVNALVIKPLLRVLEERDARIAGTRSRAEKIEQDAAAILLRYETSVRATREESERTRRSLLEEVRDEAQRETAAARREAEGIIERARGEVAAALDAARGTLRAEAQDLARQAASQVLGRAL